MSTVMCKNCKRTISKSQIRRHQKSKSCWQEATVQTLLEPVEVEMKERDWIRVAGGWYKTIEKAGISIERRLGFAMWVNEELYTEDKWWAPRWAVIVARRTEIPKETRVKILKTCIDNSGLKDAILAANNLITDKIRMSMTILDLWKGVRDD